MKKVKVYDAIMGSGKTYDAIERMKNYVKDGKKFIYITPFLSEIERIKNELPEYSIYAPLSIGDIGMGKFEIESNLVDGNGNFDLGAEATYKKISKRVQLLNLLSKGKTVVATHSLFKSLKKEDYNYFKDYILILDEVMDPLKIEPFGKRDISILIEQKLIIIDEETKEVKFICDEYNDPSFRKVKEFCKSNSVFYLDTYFFVWMFPLEIFTQFKEVQILTYMFKGSLLCAYFKMLNIKYSIISTDERNELNIIKGRLKIYKGRANEDKNSLASFSKSWCDKIKSQKANSFKEKASNIFKRKFKTKSEFNAFTTFKNSRVKFSGGSYSKGFIAVNSRATNDYRHIKSMAYLANRYFNPQQVNFFRERGVELNHELWALSELVQWIWRGCIREGKEMNLYIPSYRMRDLLYRWLDGEFLENSILKIEKDIA
jgi:hypothetical protein